ncbi:MAG: hypothetical protein NTW59_03015 [Candidatus Diapherotrites archaeon]|nr:hypothetical protein [Candidatus Diapherotrites archaeon]
MAKFRCPDCKNRFDLDIGEFDEGDFVNCPECNLELVVEVKEGKQKLRIAKEKEIDEDEDEFGFDEAYEEE